jgi:hypothetical protein
VVERRWAAAAIALVLAPPAEEPIRIFVISSAKGESSVVETIDEGRSELESRVRKKKRSFLLVSSPEEADVVVDLRAYWIREQMVYSSPDGSHETEMNEVEEHHSLLAMVTVFGTPREMTGVHIKKTGASVKGAARDLLEQIERYLKENPPRGEARTASVRNGA